MFEKAPREPAPSLTATDVAMLDALAISLAETRRAKAALDAMEEQILYTANVLALSRVDASRGDGDLPVREVAAELAAAIHVSDRSIQRRLAAATIVSEQFAATLDALAAGVIAQGHVRVIVEAGARIEDASLRAQYEREVLAVAAQETPGRLRRFAVIAAERALPRALAERHRDAAEGRNVGVTDLDDGMSELRALVPTTLAHGIFDRLSHQGRAVIAADSEESRTLDQLRADLLCDLALTAQPMAHEPTELLGAITAEVSLTVPVLTLDGGSTEPALLDGAQPVDVATALQLVGASAGWDRVLTHPITRAVLAVDRYRPSGDLRRHLRAIDERCRFPGCMTAPRRCDLDHVEDAARGGPTAANNLTHLCRRHHVLKHQTHWSYAKSDDGSITWTSPTGRSYPDRVLPRVMFVPAQSGQAGDAGAPPPF